MLNVASIIKSSKSQKYLKTNKSMKKKTPKNLIWRMIKIFVSY